MDGRCLIRGALAGMVLGALVYQPDVLAQDDVQEPLIEETPAVTHVHEEPGHIHDLINSVRGYVDPENAEVLSMHQLACLIDDLENRLQYRGRMVVKGPDVWGQNRMTQYRGEYEDQMKTQLANFEIILSSYQRRADLRGADQRNVCRCFACPPGLQKPQCVDYNQRDSAGDIPSAASLVGPNGLVANANSLIGTMSPLLMSQRSDHPGSFEQGSCLGTGTRADGATRRAIAVYQLPASTPPDQHRRRSSDLPGYSLYLLRLPVSILPGDQSIRGKGATVTVKAKHDLTPDLLENTFRQVVILDTAYQLMDAVTRGQYLEIGDDPDCNCEANPLNGIKLVRPDHCEPKKVTSSSAQGAASGTTAQAAPKAGVSGQQEPRYAPAVPMPGGSPSGAGVPRLARKLSRCTEP